MKHCSKCGLTLPLSEFPVRSARTQKPSAYCKPCQREYCRAHYRTNGRKHNIRRYGNQKRYRIANRQRFYEYLKNKSCVDCGERDPLVLEFDHVRGEKCGNISEMVSNGASWTRIECELAKCEIRCANCHRRKTARDFKWFKGDFGA